MKKTFFLPVILAAVLTSCMSNKPEAVTAKTFMTSLSEGNMNHAEIFYPDLAQIGTIQTVGKVSVDNIYEGNGDSLKVSVLNKYTDSLGISHKDKVVLYLAKDEAKPAGYVIYDSKGLYDVDSGNDPYYELALKIGGIKKSYSYSDQDYVEILANTAAFAAQERRRASRSSSSQLVISGIRAKGNPLGGAVYGGAQCVNKSNQTLYNITYKISYINGWGEVVTQDRGVVTKGALGPGQSISFSYYTPYVDYATDIKIEAFGSSGTSVDKQILNKKYKGNEYTKFMSKRK